MIIRRYLLLKSYVYRVNSWSLGEMINFNLHVKWCVVIPQPEPPCTQAFLKELQLAFRNRTEDHFGHKQRLNQGGKMSWLAMIMLSIYAESAS